MDVDLNASPAASGQLSSSATASSSTQDPVPNNNAQENTLAVAEV